MKRQLSNSHKRLHNTEVPTLPVNKLTKKNKEIERVGTGSHRNDIEEKNLITVEKNTNNEEMLNKFLEFCKPLAGKMGVTLDDWTKISKNVFTGYHAANTSYTMSDEFMNLISDTRKTIENNSSTVLIELHTVAKELKAYKIRKSKRHKQQEYPVSKYLKPNQISNNFTEGLKTSDVTLELKANDLKTKVVEQEKIVNENIVSVSTLSTTPSLDKTLKTDTFPPPALDCSLFDSACKSSTIANILHTAVLSKNSYIDSLYLTSKPSTSNSDAVELIESFNYSSCNMESKSGENARPHTSTSIEPSSPISVVEISEDSDASSFAPENVMLANSTESKRNALREKYIHKLERCLEKIDKIIKQHQEKELSLDDLDDDQSSYIIEDKLKNRFMKIWSVLCKEKKQSVKVGRETDKPIVYRATRYEAVNKAVENFVNSKKVFPDFPDICQVVNNAHKELDLGLQSYARIELARKIFEEIGTQLKQRRLKDFRQSMGSLLANDPDRKIDPADQDVNLRKILDENAASASDKLDEVFDVYAMKQVKLKDEEKADSSDSSNEDNAPALNKSDLSKAKSLRSCCDGKLSAIQVKANSSDSSNKDNDPALNESDLAKTESYRSSFDEDEGNLPRLGSSRAQPLQELVGSVNLNADRKKDHLDNEVIDITSDFSDVSTEPNCNAEYY